MPKAKDAEVVCEAGEAEPDHGLPFALLVVAAVALGLAVRDSQGNISPLALSWLTLALAAALSSLLLPRPKAGSHSGDFRWLTIAAISTQFAALLWEPTLMSLGEGVRLCSMLLMGAAVLCGCLVMAPPRIGRWVMPLLFLVHFVLGYSVLTGLRVPGIDVIMFQEGASQALLQGHDPYAVRFPDRYPPASSAMFYGPGVSVNGVLQFGYPYLPATLWMALPGHLAGDVRYASFAAMMLAAILIAYARPGRASYLAAAVLLFSPAFPLMLVLGWTDGYVLLLLAVVWFCHCRARWLLPYAAGLLLCSKQYMVIVAPLVLLLVDRPWTLKSVWAFAWRALLTGCVVTLPLALWDIGEFWRSAGALQFKQPFRPDALSYLVWLQPSDPSRWLFLPFAVVAAVWALLWRLRSRVTFSLAATLVLFAFFAVNKQAFANYYYLVIGALCVAGAAMEQRVSE